MNGFHVRHVVLTPLSPREPGGRGGWGPWHPWTSDNWPLALPESKGVVLSAQLSGIKYVHGPPGQQAATKTPLPFLEKWPMKLLEELGQGDPVGKATDGSSPNSLRKGF